MMISARPPSTSERLDHPNERLMMMSAASLTARAAIFHDDVGGTSLHERAAAPPGRAHVMMSAASLTARAAIFDDDVGRTCLHERAAAPPERVSDDDAGGEFHGQGYDF